MIRKTKNTHHTKNMDDDEITPPVRGRPQFKRQREDDDIVEEEGVYQFEPRKNRRIDDRLNARLQRKIAALQRKMEYTKQDLHRHIRFQQSKMNELVNRLVPHMDREELANISQRINEHEEDLTTDISNYEADLVKNLTRLNELQRQLSLHPTRVVATGEAAGVGEEYDDDEDEFDEEMYNDLLDAWQEATSKFLITSNNQSKKMRARQPVTDEEEDEFWLTRELDEAAEHAFWAYIYGLRPTSDVKRDVTEALVKTYNHIDRLVYMMDLYRYDPHTGRVDSNGDVIAADSGLNIGPADTLNSRVAAYRDVRDEIGRNIQSYPRKPLGNPPGRAAGKDDDDDDTTSEEDEDARGEELEKEYKEARILYGRAQRYLKELENAYRSAKKRVEEGDFTVGFTKGSGPTDYVESTKKQGEEWIEDERKKFSAYYKQFYKPAQIRYNSAKAQLDAWKVGTGKLPMGGASSIFEILEAAPDFVDSMVRLGSVIGGKIGAALSGSGGGPMLPPLARWKKTLQMLDNIPGPNRCPKGVKCPVILPPGFTSWKQVEDLKKALKKKIASV